MSYRQHRATWNPLRTANRLGICIGDVAGKGITAALLMANLQASFRAFATQRRILEEVTNFCSSNFQDDATILVAAID